MLLAGPSHAVAISKRATIGGGGSGASVAQAIMAVLALCVGFGVYWFDRQPNGVYFLSAWPVEGNGAAALFGSVGNYLPTFVHVYAFILLTAAVMATAPRQVAGICALWLVIDSVFELAQIDVIAQAIAAHVPGWFMAVPLLENTAAYFLRGTFDVIDLVSIAAGALAAYLTITITIRRKYVNAY